jgi:DNA-binding transcriptional MerR regulator
MPRPRVGDYYRFMTSSDVCRKLGITDYQLRTRLAQGVFLAPTRVDQQGVRYFDEDWLRAARKALEKWKEKRG